MKQRCSFCGEICEPGKGVLFVKNDGTLHFFCSSKCSKNFSLGRVPIHSRWTRRYRVFREETLGLGKEKKKEKEKKPSEQEPKREIKKKKVKKISKRKLRKREARKSKRGAKK